MGWGRGGNPHVHFSQLSTFLHSMKVGPYMNSPLGSFLTLLNCVKHCLVAAVGQGQDSSFR